MGEAVLQSEGAARLEAARLDSEHDKGGGAEGGGARARAEGRGGERTLSWGGGMPQPDMRWWITSSA